MSPPKPRIKRRYPRRTVRVDVVYRSAWGAVRATATTLGAGGMFIATEEPLPRRSKLEVRFALPGRPDRVHEISATVVWCNSPGEAGGNALGMGIRFDDQAACAALAAQLEEDPPGTPQPEHQED